MSRRAFVFLAGACCLTARRGQAKPSVLQLRLDAQPDGAASCCGPGKVYVTDLQHRARFASLDWSQDGVLSVGLPVREPVAVHFDLALPGYGRVWVTLDNEGQGYEEGSTKPLAVLHEAVKSRLARCGRRMKETGQAKDSTGHLERAEELSRAGKLGDALREAIMAGEEIEFAASQARLAGPGKVSNARISGILFGERQGKYAIGVGSDWPEGTAPPDFLLPRDVWRTIAELCDGTTIPSFWRWIEPVRGDYRWKPLDEILDFCGRQGMAAKSFSIFWGGIGGTPPWFRGLSYDRQKAAIEGWCRAIVQRYRGRIVAWETVNEMHDWAFANPRHWSHEQLLEVTILVNETVGALDPVTPRVINSCCIWGDYVQRLGEGFWTPLGFLDEAISRGVPFEGIGLQYYNPGRDLMECAAHLDRFSRLGKQVWITEMGTPSKSAGSEAAWVTKHQRDSTSFLAKLSAPAVSQKIGQADPMDGWRGPWSLERQADWCEYWYSMALSRPFVRAMNWWDVVDSRAFVASGGLLDATYKRKPAFDRLVRLCQRLKVGAPGKTSQG
jgi:GH35 family endo-1,4-beta-xylanase